MTPNTTPLDRAPRLARLRVLAAEDRLPPSLLLVGPEGSGKEWAAIELAALLLERPGSVAPAGGLFDGIEPEPVADANAARLVRGLAHPDLYYVCPVASDLDRDGYRALLEAKAHEPLGRVHQPGSAIIPIGNADDPGLVSVRAIRRFLQAPPFQARYRVVIVGDAHRMNRQAANALLKTLEEPPSFGVLLLCTHQPHLLPSTIRSRCARVPVPAFAEEELAALLTARHGLEPAEAARVAAVAGGNARRALDLIDPVARELSRWARELLEALLALRRLDLARAADRVAKGQPPSGKSKLKVAQDAGLAAGRDIGLRVLDAMVADLVALARRASGARLDDARRASLPTADGGHSAPALLGAAEVLLHARGDIARNVNVALALQHGLLEASDRLHGRAGRGS